MKAFNYGNRINEITIAKDTHNVWIHITQWSFLHDWFFSFSVSTFFLASFTSAMKIMMKCWSKRGILKCHRPTREHQFWNHTIVNHAINNTEIIIITSIKSLFKIDVWFHLCDIIHTKMTTMCLQLYVQFAYFLYYTFIRFPLYFRMWSW